MGIDFDAQVLGTFVAFRFTRRNNSHWIHKSIKRLEGTYNGEKHFKIHDENHREDPLILRLHQYIQHQQIDDRKFDAASM